MSVWMVVWIVLMMFWLLGCGYWSWDPQRPAVLGNVIVPWACVLILGLMYFGAISSGHPTTTTTVIVPK